MKFDDTYLRPQFGAEMRTELLQRVGLRNEADIHFLCDLALCGGSIDRHEHEFGKHTRTNKQTDERNDLEEIMGGGGTQDLCNIFCPKIKAIERKVLLDGRNGRTETD